jgi:hypothetical protein
MWVYLVAIKYGNLFSDFLMFNMYKYPAWCHFIWLFYLHNCKLTVRIVETKQISAPVSTGSVSAVLFIRGLPRPEKKFAKLNKWKVHKFQNERQARTGCSMVKSSSPNAPSTWLISLCPRTHAKTSQNKVTEHEMYFFILPKNFVRKISRYS